MQNSLTHLYGQDPSILTERVTVASMQVSDAISRQKKEQVVQTLQEELEKSIVLFGVRYKKIPVCRSFCPRPCLGAG